MHTLFVAVNITICCAHLQTIRRHFENIVTSSRDLRFILIVIIRPLPDSIFDYLLILFRIAWWSTAGKELTS